MAAGFAIIRSLKLPRSDFRSAILIIAIGSLTVVVAFCRMIVLIVRMTSTDKHYNYLYASADQSADFDQQISVPLQESVIGYAEVEAILACIAACLPGIRVLFRRRARVVSERWTFKDSADARCFESMASSSPPYTPPTSPPMVFEKGVRVHEMV